MQTLIYIRVSTRTQDGGLETQRGVCAEYAHDQGWDDTIEYIDYAESGRKESRKAFDEMRAYMLSTDKPFRVLVYKEDRIARDFIIGREFQKLVNATQSELHSPFGGKLDVSTSAGKFQFDLRMLLAENEINQFMERSRYGMVAHLKRGVWVFKLPFGYSRLGSQRIISPDYRAKDMKYCLEQISRGLMNPPGMQQYLVGRGHKMSKAHAYELLNNAIHFYAGYIHYPKWGVLMVKALHQPIISPEVYHNLIEVIKEGKRTARTPSSELHDFALAGHVSCACCRKSLIYYVAKKQFPYYVCRTNECSEKGRHIPAQKLEKEFAQMLQGIKLNKAAADIIVEVLDDEMSVYLGELRDRQKMAQKTIEKLKKDVQGLIEQSMTAPDSVRSKIYAKITALEAQISVEEKHLNIQTEETNTQIYRTALKKTLNFYQNLDQIWINESVERRKELLKLLFKSGLGYQKDSGFRTPTFSDIIQKIRLFGGGDSALEPSTRLFSNFIYDIIQMYESIRRFTTPV